MFRRLNIKVSFLAINDGSTDQSLDLLEKAAARWPELTVVSKLNSGHGQSCIYGYKFAIQNGADYVFQIDSDGQCDPKFFEVIWSSRSEKHSVFGYRISRDDGMFRLFASRIVSIVAFFATGVWLKDANVPYRLMPRSILERAVILVPDHMYLANILVSVLVKKISGILWVPIHFRNRLGGSPSAKMLGFAKQGFRLYFDLRRSITSLRRHL